ncbi:MAG TPA: FG-GAP-like repeat-containing protein [Pyrinomonadaceae bacterium]|nr:FG-GAP-like repeat-containing protein [Pyrinomonadaceae bacterium]
MIKRRLRIAILVAFAALSLVAPPYGRHSAQRSAVAAAPEEEGRQSAPDAREAAYRANNLGVALLEQFKHAEGAEQFRRALELDPQLALAQINLAVALYNVPDADAAARAAARAHLLAPDAPQPLYLQALLARARNQTDEAIDAFRRVLRIDPQDTAANVNLGQLHAQQRNYADAERAFRAALEAEPYNTTALYGLANVLLRSDRREEGQRLLQQFQALRQSGAGTSIGTNYLEQGRYAEAVTSTGAEAGLVERKTPDVIFKDATAGVLPAAPAGARGRAGIKGKRAPSRVGRGRDEKKLAEQATQAEAMMAPVAPFDYDNDGDLDLYDASPSGAHLYRNDGGKFVDVTARAGELVAPADSAATGAVAGDYDNDTRSDLFVLRGDGRHRLYHNDGGGRFSDATKAAEIPASNVVSFSAAFADVDHDGDLDIFIAGAGRPGQPSQVARNVLLRNNGNGKFTDITAAAKVAGGGLIATAVVPTDYDNRRDVDLLVVNESDGVDESKSPNLFRNLRDGSFRDVAGEVGMNVPGVFISAAAGDVNKDGFTDFFFGQSQKPGLLVMSDGKGRFKTTPAPNVTREAVAAQFLDYDNDGLLDLLTLTRDGLRICRNVGVSWADVSEHALAQALRSDNSIVALHGSRVLVSGDIDGDGDTDFIIRDATGRLRFGRNEGGNRNRSLAVRLAGRVSNRGGVESKVEMRAGSLWQKLEVYAATPAPAPADIVFGLGRRERADAVRVLWPSGTVQSETEFPVASAGIVGERPKGEPRAGAAAAANAALTVTELDRKPSSCPYLFAWNGERFEFITDFMGGGELGYWIAPGVRAAPDPDEYVRIRGDQLKPRDGRYELRVTNELEEVLFLDKLQLVAVAHPEGAEIYPGEGLGSPLASKFQLFATRAARPPARAFDEHGHDVGARIARLDRTYPDDFSLASVRGYAAEHTLTLDLGAGERAPLSARKGSAPETNRETKAAATAAATAAGRERTTLLLTGWTDYAFSSDNVAAAQRGQSLRPPALQVRDARGRWRTIVENIGVPVGRPQTIVVDLTGKFLSRRREVRIVTNMRIYWDQILFETSPAPPAPTQLTRLDATRADLRWRGFSAQTSPDGREPYLYDYTRVATVSPWKVFMGRYTREGDVRELVRGADDMFVISRPGDELTLSFDADALAPLPHGWTRTFLLYTDGYSKEMDINSASPEQVAPLPFRRMSEYPYKWPEAYPQTPAHLDYLERYNTRIVSAPLPQLIGERERGQGER